MTNTLEKICKDKRAHIARRKQMFSASDLMQRVKEAAPPRGFARALEQRTARGAAALIAEIKKASPSGGIIREDFDPATLAKAYEQGGAACLSVLTDEPYFQGKDKYLAAARNACSLPTLRKDFMLDAYQIIESRALEADAVLLIMAAISNTLARELEAAAHELGMDVLVEIHNRDELERALSVPWEGMPLMGINNRNLKTLKVDLATSESLRPFIPPEYTVVCESGIAAPADITRMRKSGMHCFLVGEALMRAPDVMQATRDLLKEAA